MPRKFDFISPGVSIKEIDQSEIAVSPEEDGILLIGNAPQGPANVPVKVKSLDDFYSTFGRPISGKGSNSTDVWRDGNQQLTTYGMYAAQSWLASGVSPVTFIRLLGTDQETAKQASGYVKAGWNTEHTFSTTAASVKAAYGLFVMPSGAAGQTLSGKLAAVIYTSGASLGLSGTIAGSTDTSAATNTLYVSDSTSGIANTYTLRISNSAGHENLTFHLDRTQKDGYIRNVLNCNPQKLNSTNYGTTKNYFLGETFDVAASDILNTSGSQGQQYAILMPLAAGASEKYSNHERQATASKSGWIINRNPNPKDGNSTFNIQPTEAVASAVETIVTTTVADSNRITIVVPTNVGGNGQTIEIDFLNAAISDPGDSKRINIFTDGGDAATAAANLISAINGESLQSKVRYGADAGNSTSGIAGITAVAGTSANSVTLKSVSTGPLANNIAAPVNVAGTMAKGVAFSGADGTALASAAEKMFRLCSLHEGEWFQQNYGVRIENLRIGTTANPDSTFSIAVINADGEAVERFDNLNLNESSANYIAKRIGDQYQTFNSTLDKYVLYGENPNNSGYIRVEMHPSFDRSDKRALPFGVYGPSKPKNLSFGSGSTTSGNNNFGILANSAGLNQGHAGDATHFANFHENANVTLNLEFPEIALTDNNTSAVGNYNKNYAFGARHMKDDDNQPKKSLWYSPDYKDLVRALPGGLDIHADTSSDYLKQSWIFSLDELRQDSNDTSKYYFERDSHKNGTSYTAANGTAALLSEGIKQFNVPFFGGSDGLDITQIDPFSVAYGLESTQNENKHYAYYSVKRAIDIIDDPDLLRYDLVSMPGLINSALTQDLIRMAEERGDTLAIVDLDGGYRKKYENSGTEILGDHKQAITNAQSRDYDTSYAATYYPPVRLRDTTSPSNDVTVVHPSVPAIGAIAFSEANSDGPWFAPAGFNRGGISTLGGVSGPRVIGTIEHLTKQNRDDLYEENINPIARFPAVGEIVIFGQKTLQQTPSALDRINVRRLMIYLKKKISIIADTILFDQNVRTTWLSFKGQADNVLANVQSRFGITEYKLVLDESTTTADLVDRNILYAKVFVKPARAIEFIAIDFIITKTGIEL